MPKDLNKKPNEWNLEDGGIEEKKDEEITIHDLLS